jgi:Tfp pilus assembly protein PilF
MKTSLSILFLVITLCSGSFINAATETSVDPEAVAAYQAGKSHVKSGNHEDAITEFERAVIIAPDYFAAYLELAHLYLEVARPFDAINAYEQLMRLEPGRTDQFQAAINIIEAYYALTLCQTSEPGLDETIAACKKAIGHPELAEDPHTNYLLGINYIYADDEESAKKQFKEMVLLDIEGAPGMLFHVMMEMKPQWITKKYVEDVNKFVERCACSRSITRLRFGICTSYSARCRITSFRRTKSMHITPSTRSGQRRNGLK